MSRYFVGFTARAEESLAALGKVQAQRVLDKIHWLASNFDSVTPAPLGGDLGGIFKLRVGDYRVFYTSERDARTITIRLVGHRREIYKNT